MSSPWESPLVEGGSASGFKPIATLSKVVIAMQVLALLLGLGTWGLSSVLTMAMPHTLDPYYIPEGFELALFGLLGVTALSQISLTLLGVPIWIWWHARAGGNVHALGHEGLEFSGSSHAWWWFVPFANLVMPYRAMKELLRSSTAESTDDYGVIPGSMGFWWACWLIGNMLTNISMRMSFRPGMESASGWIDVVAGPISFAATGFYVYYVWTVSNGQSAQAGES